MEDSVRTDFVRRATAFLEAHAPRRVTSTEGVVWGEGDDHVRVMGAAEPGREEEMLAAAASWRAEAFDAGLAWAGGPAEFGGGGHDPQLNDLWRELEAGFEVPDQSMFAVAWDMVRFAPEGGPSQPFDYFQSGTNGVQSPGQPPPLTHAFGRRVAASTAVSEMLRNRG